MTTLEQARAISDQLLDHDLEGLEVTELPPSEGAMQWRLALMLSDFEVTRPMWEVL